MTSETDLIDFAIKWRHWGGGTPEDIFREFGPSSEQYLSRLASVLERNTWMYPDIDLAPDLLAPLEHICVVRGSSRARAYRRE
ncbi:MULTISPECIES: hypothetical protein [Rhodococcus]|uniref:DUF3263 domain-containing protein n=1 Tax=Rhodococcus oxybenzonivorans TaxID=1990687 RepID=A0AAE4UVS4_9NOCA|nr:MULTISPECIES: hypothetical protein [Rhodococcus]MDV7243880.1 hypothetical protein [Rhodococcus oxybenzonivorans]MDV7263861.1 hypothetical protein [Rhodococcus oxybenzonivorans]MDV7274878.1 hypothetical protein [Rhodococcus oxybenzonivorans]MDV7335117.1 hypothetical protein [Rhodococcus oxybenzonivorans]MDV7345828.1 hypothetical protein [Rhodococcus oxybenzonivorans]